MPTKKELEEKVKKLEAEVEQLKATPTVLGLLADEVWDAVEERVREMVKEEVDEAVDDLSISR